MPLLLYRSMLLDLLRTVAITTAVLVMVIAFGAAIKPLSSDALLTAGQAVKYIVLVTIPMLQFALPFAAGFAGTISLHRMAEDNEILACAVSGMSYRRLLVPVIGLGLALMLIMIVLTQWIIPRFWGVLEQAITDDITSIFKATIERGETVLLDELNLQVYADDIVLDPDPQGTEADHRLILFGVAAAWLDERGRIETDVTANKVVADIYRQPDATVIKFVMSDTVAYQSGSGTLISMPTNRPRAQVIPSVLKDDAQSMTRGELLNLRANPEPYSAVFHNRVELAEKLAEMERRRQLDQALRAESALEIGSGSADRRLFIRAGGVDHEGRFVPRADGTLSITETRDGVPVREFRPEKARLERHVDAALGEESTALLMTNVQVRDLTSDIASNERREVRLEHLDLGRFAADDLSQLSSEQLIARARKLSVEEADEGVTRQIAKLDREIALLQQEITGRLWKRYAISVTAMLLLVFGATLAMWLRNTLPLTIYLMAFIPSIADLILISGGEQVVRDGNVALGLSIMWSGNLLLAILLAVAYLRLARN